MLGRNSPFNMRSLYLSIVITVLTAILALGWGLDSLVAEQTPKESSDITIYKTLIDGLATQLTPNNQSELNHQFNLVSNSFKFELSLLKMEDIALPPSLLKQLDSPGGVLLASQKGSYLLQRITGSNQLIQLNIPLAPQHNKLDLILTLALYSGISIILILWSLPLTRRLYLLNNAAAKFGAGQLETRIPASRFSYITMLERSFNLMANQIEKLMADNKMLARSLSHDIRTPLACLRFGVEAALDSHDIEQKNHYLTRMDNELTRMEEMTAAFLEYAGLERHGLDLKFSDIDVNQLIKSTAESYDILAQQHQVKLSYQVPDSSSDCRIDCHWIARAIQNLLVNGMRFATTQVLLTVVQTKNHITITIEDDGQGIAPEDFNTIFEPFVRLIDHQTRENGHFGLGLAITAKIIQWHHGKITVSQSALLGGACFSLVIPKS